MKKNWRTTLIGVLLAALLAAKPVLDGTGYNMDVKTTGELFFAVGLACLGALSKDYNQTGKSNE